MSSIYNLKNKTVENRLLRRIFGPRGDEVMERSTSVELDSFYLFPNYLGVLPLLFLLALPVGRQLIVVLAAICYCPSPAAVITASSQFTWWIT
jgi:hypothetical protein